jgi:non-ribosomal peptide synthetase component F/thioesterase domain-containing protein
MVTTAMYLQILSDGLLQRDARHFSDRTPFPESQAELANARWMNCPDIPLDMGGPVDRPFAPLGAGFADVPAIEHLNALARRFADRIAISDGVSEITYSDLLARVLTLANAISAATPKGQAVASLLRNSVWQPIAVLACMAAGTPLVPLNPRDPAQRLTDITAAARISVLIGQDGTHAAEWIENGGIRQIDVIRASEPAAAASPLTPIPVDAAALVLYTSGSTGQPKGVVNSQRSLLQRVQHYVDACHIDAGDVFMPLSGPTTIAGCREMLSALLTGARLHVVDVEALGLRGLLRQIRSQRVTITYVVPTLLRAVIAASQTGDFDSLRIVRIGGEKVLWTDIALVRKVTEPECFIQISYSSTETQGTHWFLSNNCEERDAGPPVGYLLPGLSFAVIDDSGASVPIGEVGELVIKSPYVLLGYWESGQLCPALPAPDDPDCRIFATGDLVTLDAGGLLRVVGRKGRQLKINGRRVEPAELETVTRRIPYVRDAVALVTDSNELIFFVSPVDHARAGFSADVREVIRQKLPAALHPTRLHEIAELPRLAGGKIDVGKLKMLDLDAHRSSPSPRLPQPNEMMQAREAVGQVWTAILGTTEVAGRWDEAGGDSLKLLRCVMELEELIGRELNMEAFTLDMSAADMIHVVATGDRPQRQNQGEEVLPALVMLPGSMGYGPSLAAFGAQLSKVARVIPIRYPDLSSTLVGCGSLGDMTASALEQIKAVQPRGDIRLIGYSLGGGVAFEVARRLIAEGRSVKFIGILDTNVAPRTNDHRETLSRTLQRIRSHRVTMYRMLCRALAKCVVRLGWEVPFCRFLDAGIWQHFADTRFIFRLELEEILRMQAFALWVAGSKEPLPITGTLFACTRRGPPTHFGWGPLFAQLDIIPIAGGHLDLVIEPHLSVNLPVIERVIASSCSSS